MSAVIITGGTGLIGTALARLLVSQGHTVTILSRNPAAHRIPASPAIRYAAWNIEEQSVNEDAIRNARYIIHLAGAAVADKRWTKKRKQEIQDSRVKSDDLLVKALTQIPNQVEAVVSASAIGWYVESDTVQRVETDPPDPGFLGETCRLWEEHIQPVTGLGKRLVILRTGIVLGNGGGAFPAFKKPVSLGIAAILGNGKQIISWIHLDDICRLFLEAMTNPAWSGIYNAVSPQPVTNKTFMLQLGNRMKKNFFISLPVPAFLLRALLGQKSVEVLKSSNISSEKIRKQGFQFIYPSLDAAFKDLLHR